jgi:hypothetical protein
VGSRAQSRLAGWLRAHGHLLLCAAALHSVSGLSVAAGPDAATTDAAVPAPVLQQLGHARLLGAGSLRMYGFHIYDARLFVGSQGIAPQRIAAAPLALDVAYARAFGGASIAARGRDEMERQHLDAPDQVLAWGRQMSALFPDVQAGDHILAVFRPGAGTTFYFNGRRLGAIEGDDFAAGFFSIWLAAQTTAPGLRRALLGQADSD